MNLAHLHLIINHLPIVGVPVALVFLAHGLIKGNASSRRFALMMLFLISMVVLPVYFTGEPAEEVVEHLPGVSESLIEAHEDAAKASLILTLVTGATAIVALIFQRDERKGKAATMGVMGVGVLALLSLMYTGNLGGKIRHTEIRGDSAVSAESGAMIKGEEKEKEDHDD